ncbi:MAG TPA: helicase HerA-like domain-containing protein, partial [Polyangiaceae bacterium]|nr:helicase HerA-like domain-containing protein [Polyangiaceae bacterium]
MDRDRRLHLGSFRPLSGQGPGHPLRLPAHHLVTHGVIVGMTGSGKTGLVTVMAEEALRCQVPTIIIDVKGDLPNLLVAFPSLDPALIGPWLGGANADLSEADVHLAIDARRQALDTSGIGEMELAQFFHSTRLRVITPGSSAGEPLHVLSSLERRSSLWDSDHESARSALSAAVSLLLRLIGREPDPAKSKEHVLLCVLAERRFLTG